MYLLLQIVPQAKQQNKIKTVLYLLARITMSIPQNILMIQPTITIAVRI